MVAVAVDGSGGMPVCPLVSNMSFMLTLVAVTVVRVVVCAMFIWYLCVFVVAVDDVVDVVVFVVVVDDVVVDVVVLVVLCVIAVYWRFF